MHSGKNPVPTPVPTKCLERFHRETASFLHKAILRGQIYLEQLPLALRFHPHVCIAAFRATRNTYRAEETLKTVMDDVYAVLHGMENERDNRTGDAPKEASYKKDPTDFSGIPLPTENTLLMNEAGSVVEAIEREVTLMRAGYFESEKHREAFEKHTYQPFAEMLDRYRKEADKRIAKP